MTMSFRGISFILFAIIAPALANAADGPSDRKNDLQIDGTRFFTTAPPATTNTPPISTPPATSLSEYITVESLEWMAADCQVIVRGTVLDSESNYTTVIRFRVEESIKGDLISGAVLTLESLRGRTDPAHSGDVYRGDKAIFFLKENRGFDSKKYPLRPRWREGTINLSRTGYTFAVLMDCTRLTDPQKIMTEVRSASRFNIDPAKKPVLVASSTLLENACFVLPPDDRTEKLARNWLENKRIDYRVLGVRALHDFKSDQNVALARRLLYDTQTSSPRGVGKWQAGFFAVRVEAQNLLNDWKIPHAEVPEMGPVYVYQPIALSRALLIWPVLFLVLLASLILLRRRGYVILVAFTASLLCIAVIGSVSWQWVRSKTTVDEVMFSSAAAHHEIASYNGGLQYQLMGDWTIRSPLVFGSFDLQRYDNLWSATALSPLVTSQMAGFMSGHGHLAGPAGVIHPYKVLRIPYWVLILPFAIALFSQLYLLLRQLRRRQGYDLRENSTGKCPECGADVVSYAHIKTGNKMSIRGQAVGM